MHYDYPNDIINHENIDKGLDDYHSFLEFGGLKEKWEQHSDN